MVAVTFEVGTYGHELLTGAQPYAVFIPRTVGIEGSVVRVKRPITYPVAANGTVTADLVPTDAASPPVVYDLEIRYFDPSGELTYRDQLARDVRVPITGGILGEFADMELSPASVWVAAGPPPLSWRGFWYNTLTDDWGAVRG